MNEDIFYPSVLIVAGVLFGTLVIIFLTRVSNSLLRFFQFYPESQEILRYSLRFISWFTGLAAFLVFLRLALRLIGLEVTTLLIEQLINALPHYVLAVVIVLGGVYVSRTIRERARNSSFEYKPQLVFLVDFIINMAFILTALLQIGVDITVFLELFRVILWVLCLIVVLLIGIPLGLIFYHRLTDKDGSHSS
jgi:hypothetical protein